MGNTMSMDVEALQEEVDRCLREVEDSREFLAAVRKARELCLEAAERGEEHETLSEYFTLRRRLEAEVARRGLAEDPQAVNVGGDKAALRYKLRTCQYKLLNIRREVNGHEGSFDGEREPLKSLLRCHEAAVAEIRELVVEWGRLVMAGPEAGQAEDQEELTDVQARGLAEFELLEAEEEREEWDRRQEVQLQEEIADVERRTEEFRRRGAQLDVEHAELTAELETLHANAEEDEREEE